MSDLTITINPPVTNTIAIGEGILPHAVTHAPNGSDSLTSWYATADDLSKAVFITGDQNIFGVKNFYSRPTVNGSGLMLTGETVGTGYLTGYVNKSETGLFVSSGNTGNFVTTSQTGQFTGAFYPYSANPAAYIQGAVVRPSNTGNFVDINSSQTINGQKVFTTRISAPTANLGTGNFIGGGNGITVIGDYNGVTGSFNYIFGGSGNIITNTSASNLLCKDNKIIGSENSLNGGSLYSNVIIGKTSSLNEASFSSSNQPTYISNILIGDTNEVFFLDDEPEVNVNGNLLIGNDNNLQNGGVGNLFLGLSNFSSSRRMFSSLIGYNNESSSDNSMAIGFSAVSSGENTVLIKGPSGVFLEGPATFNNRPTYNGTGFLLSGEAGGTSTTGISISGNSTKTIFLYQSDDSILSGSFVDQQGTGGGPDFYIYSGSFNAANGNLTLNRTGDTGTVVVSLDGRFVTGSVVRPAETGVFYPTSNPSGYITGIDLSPYATTTFVTGISGYQSGLISSLQSATGVLDARLITVEGVTGSFALAANTGAFLTTGAGDVRYVNASGDTVNGNLEVTGYTSGQTFVVKNGGYIDFQTGTPSWKEGRVFYDDDSKTLSYFNDEPDVTVNIGQESIIRVSNGETGNILNGRVVYISGSQGNRPKGYLASAASGSPAWDRTIGIATHDISTQGYVTTFGVVNGLNTTGFIEGDHLYLSETVPGTFSTTIPNSPNHKVQVGTVLRSHATQGSIFVTINQGNHLWNLHDVKRDAWTNDQILRYNESSGYWEARNLNTGIFTQTGFVTGISGSLQSQITSLNNQTGLYVLLTGSQTISGNKEFNSRPTVGGTGVILQGEVIESSIPLLSAIWS